MLRYIEGYFKYIKPTTNFNTVYYFPNVTDL